MARTRGEIRYPAGESRQCDGPRCEAWLENPREGQRFCSGRCRYGFHNPPKVKALRQAREAKRATA